MAINTAGLLGGLVSGYGLYDQYQQLADVGQDYQQAVQPIISQAQEGLQFRPYTVTSNVGGTQVSPEGQLSLTPSQQLQDIQSQAFGGAQQLFGQALAPQAERQQQVYDMLRAVQTPAEQRQQMQLNNRLFAQGRSGVQTAAYGGTPEQLAQAKAVEEAKNQAALLALTQAQAEQQQNYNIGAGMLSAGFTPEAQLLNQQQQANQMAQTAVTPQTTAATIAANLGLGGVEAAQAAEANRMNLLQQMYSLGAGMLGGTENSVTGEMRDGALTDPINKLFSGLLGSLSGGNSDFNLDAYTPTSLNTLTTPAYQAAPPAPTAPSGGFDFAPIGGQVGIYDNYV